MNAGKPSSSMFPFAANVTAADTAADILADGAGVVLAQWVIGVVGAKPGGEAFGVIIRPIFPIPVPTFSTLTTSWYPFRFGIVRAGCLGCEIDADKP